MIDCVDYRVSIEWPIVTLVVNKEGWGSFYPATYAGIEVCAHSGKPKPTNTVPGMAYMLCGATQHSNTDPFDKTSPAIPIGPHWMILWPFDAATYGLPETLRDKGAWMMFADTPYGYLHICGSPWKGNEYQPDKPAIWTMSYPQS